MGVGGVVSRVRLRPPEVGGGCLAGILEALEL